MNPILQTFLETFATAVATGLLGVITTFGLKFLNLQNSAKANAFVQSATQNAAGMIAHEVHLGLTDLGAVHITSPRVQAAVQYVQDRVTDAVQTSGVSPETLALMIVGKVQSQLAKVSVPGVDVPAIVAQVKAQLTPQPVTIKAPDPTALQQLAQRVSEMPQNGAILGVPHPPVAHVPEPTPNLVPEKFNAQSSPPVPGVPVTTAAEDSAQHGEKHA